MPTFIDIHDAADITADQIEEAHLKDLAVQDEHGVSYVQYWHNVEKGKVFCLCTAPSAEAARRVHEKAHGDLAQRIVEVDPELLDVLLGGGTVAASGAVMFRNTPERDPGVRTIVFTDIVGSTALTQRLGDRAAMAIVNLHDSVVRAALRGTHGREVKHLGDGIMAAFTSAGDALACAAAIHEALRAAAPVSGEAVRVKIGAAAGEPVERSGDFFGSTVQLAARLCAQASAEQTLVSTRVTELCTVTTFEDVGELSLKGFAEPVRAHAVVR